MKWILPVILGFFLSGCVSDIDTKINQCDQDLATAWSLTEAGLGQSLVAFQQTQQQKAQYEQKAIQDSVSGVIGRHTGADGRLYASTRPGDPPTAMRAEDVYSIMAQRDQLMLKSMLDNQRAIEVIQKTQQGIATYSVAIKTLMDKKTDWLEKRKSTQAALNAALSSVVGSAATFIPMAITLF